MGLKVPVRSSLKMAKSMVVDSDGHVLEPADMWERYLEPKYRERAIRIRDGPTCRVPSQRSTPSRVSTIATRPP